MKKQINQTIKRYTDRLDQYGRDAHQRGHDLGVQGGAHNGQMDAFRHAYVSAVVARDDGALTAAALGTANEIKGFIQNGQPLNEMNMDEHNNGIGRAIGERARKNNWNDERVAYEVKRALDKGFLIDDIEDQQQNLEKMRATYSFKKQVKQDEPATEIRWSGETDLEQQRRTRARQF